MDEAHPERRLEARGEAFHAPGSGRVDPPLDGLGDAARRSVARAGVSIGSLYQYFDNKDALVGALVERITRELAAVIDQQLSAFLEADVRTAVRGLLTGVFDLLEGNAAYIELARHWPEARGLRVIPKLEKHTLEATQQYIMRHHHALRSRDLNLPAAMFVIITSSLYTVVHYLGAPRPFLKRQEVVDTMSEMIAAFVESYAGVRSAPNVPQTPSAPPLAPSAPSAPPRARSAPSQARSVPPRARRQRAK